ncbi:MAG TPA: HprK-related kinase B [Humidesulfovibrio sp.]|uniref:HprK-related kinase B n=1 Tax=Humidesulfovibrio sp. TaxID=2910988 RepID=UPI002B8C0845|nr:HprK-related kinase B [Humidesulfovibrio sp.]HWR05067.1 HprK-related kinase B [Humidesulfovibrio sp.]
MSRHGYVMSTLADMLGASAPAPHALNLDLGDCRIEVRSNSQALLSELDAYFGGFVTRGGGADVCITALDGPAPQVPLELTVKEPDPGKTKVKEEYADVPGGRLVRKALTGMVFLFGQGRNLAFGPCLENSNQVVNFINNRYIEYKLHQGCLLGHAAAVAHLMADPGGGRLRGLALCGFSGAGKSTLAMHVMSRGALFVSNDRLLAAPLDGAGVPAGAGLRMCGVPKLPRINPGTALNNPHLAGVVPDEDRERFMGLDADELWELEHKYDVFLDKCFGEGRFVLQSPMHGLVVLNWRRGGGETAIRFVKAAERPDLLPAFMKPAGLFSLPLNGDAAWRDPGEAAYAGLLSRCDIIEISGGVDFDRAADFCIEYLVHG